MRIGWNALLLLCACLPLMASSSRAEDRVLLEEVMPELAGTPLGAVDVAPAPAPGTTLTLRRADLVRALAQAGIDPKSVKLPRSARVTREPQTLTRDMLASEAAEALDEATAPCQVRDARYPLAVRVTKGPRTMHAEFPRSLRDGTQTGAVVVESGGRSVRVPVMVTLTCPPPDVTPGMQVTALAIVGQVTASAPAEARQAGRAGDIIRITNHATGASLRARVIDASTVEVVP